MRLYQKILPWRQSCGASPTSEILSIGRLFSSTIRSSSEVAYVDSWFESIVKPTEFYAKHSAQTVRRYFYNVDLHGRLFLEEILPKNITSCIKDEKFLNFFFSRIQKIREEDKQFLAFEGIDTDYPFVSLCGKEVNFIRPAATPIVFHSLERNTLYFGGTLPVPFEPASLAVSPRTGQLFHKIKHRSQSSLLQDEESLHGEFGLIRSSVAVTLSDHIKAGQGDENDSALYFCMEGNEFLIARLPTASEPGEWALPANIDK